METVRFEQLNLYPQVLRAIEEMGFEEATPIQSQAIPVVMSGVDVIGQAQTGTGKTASFGIPVLHKVDPDNRKTQVIILSPTRELAIQVADEIRRLGKYMHGIKVLPVYGGQEIGRQIKALKGGAQIIIGTPGRVFFLDLKSLTAAFQPFRSRRGCGNAGEARSAPLRLRSS